MTNQNSISSQAEVLSQLFEESANVLEDYKRTKSHADTLKFDSLIVQISDKWKVLAESYKRLDDKKVKEAFEKIGDSRSDKQSVMHNMTITVNSGILTLKNFKENIDKGIDDTAHAVHMATTPKIVAKIIREELTYYFRD